MSLKLLFIKIQASKYLLKIKKAFLTCAIYELSKLAWALTKDTLSFFIPSIVDWLGVGVVNIPDLNKYFYIIKYIKYSQGKW